MKKLTSVLFATCLLAGINVHATPFASCISNIANTVYFNLNEAGGNVTVTYEDGSTNANFNGVTTGLNLPVGYQHFDFTGHTSYAISVYKIGSGSPSIITNIARGSARGIAANVRPTSPYFGYVYSVIGGAGAVVMRSDGSGGAAGNPFPGSTLKPPSPDFTWTSGSTSQYFISVAPDDYVLISDYQSGSEGGIIRVDPTFTSSRLLLANLTGLTPNDTVDFNHGTAESRAILTAGIGNNPTLYVVDGTWQSPYNQILKYNLGSANYGNGTLPYAAQPDSVLAEVNPANVQGLGGTLRSGLSIGTNGYFYVSVDRANLSNPNLQVYGPDGLTMLWTSFYTNNGVRADYTVTGTTQLPETGSGTAESALSPDNRYIALVHDDNHITVFTLTNGIPDLSTEYLITGLGTASFGRGICWDAANNLWMASSGLGQVYHYSVGRTATAITTGDASGPTGFQVLSPTEVDIAATQPNAAQPNSYGFPTTAIHTVTRSGDVSSPLTVPFTVSGTAPTSTYVVSATNSISFAPGQSSTNITVTAVNDGIARPTTTVIIKLGDAGSGQYIVGFQNQTTTFIINEQTPQLVLAPAAGTMYKAYSNDFTSITVTRWGDTNTAFTTAPFTYSGTAVNGTDFAPVNTTVTFAQGNLTKTVTVAKPLVNGLPPQDVTPTTYTGNKTITIGVGSGAGYTTVASNGVATVTILDNAYPPSTVLYSNPLTDPNDAANWAITATSGDITAPPDYTVDFGYDLTVNNPNAGFNGVIPLPPSGATTALRVTCNKNTGSQSTAVNLYPNVTFSGNYAVRFNMYLMQGQFITTSAEGPLFGINHDGLETNWWYSSGPITAGNSWSADGVWYWLGAWAGGYTSDYMEFTGITNGIPNSGWRRPATSTFASFANQFKDPQIFTTLNSSSNAVSGLPANASPFVTNKLGNWADVEIRNSNNIVTLSINKTTVFTFSNTNSLFQSGHPMLGYEVPNAEYAGNEAAVYFSDFKVVSLATATTATVQITRIQQSGGTVTITFTSSNTSDAASAFVLRSSSTVDGAFSDNPSAVITGSGGTYQATIPVSGTTQFYRIKR